MDSGQHMMWIVVTNSNSCHIYNYNKEHHQLSLYKIIDHPENKLRDIDLTSDKPGHYKSSGSARGAFSQPTDPKEIKIDAFSREIAKELEHGRNMRSYEKLGIIAPPHMNGLLLQHLDKHVKDLIAHDIEKDLMHLNENELLNFIEKHTHYGEES